MKPLLLLLAAAPLLLASPAGAADIRDVGSRMKEPIVLEATSSPLLNVTFRHDTHRAVPCRTCHHEEGSDGMFVPCTECHEPTQPRDDDPMSLFQAHHAKDSDRSCYGCHSSLRAMYPQDLPMFTNCRPCHMSDEARALATGKSGE